MTVKGQEGHISVNHSMENEHARTMNFKRTFITVQSEYRGPTLMLEVGPFTTSLLF